MSEIASTADEQTFRIVPPSCSSPSQAGAIIIP